MFLYCPLPEPAPDGPVPDALPPPGKPFPVTPGSIAPSNFRRSLTSAVHETRVPAARVLAGTGVTTGFMIGVELE